MTDICTVDGCDRKVRARSLCSMHYDRLRRQGHPGEAAPRIVHGRPLADRFWEKVDKGQKPADCWLWTAQIDDKGYGRFKLRSGVSGTAHRISYELTTGAPIDPRLEIDHLCRVRHCCNPDHLEAVTKAENIRRGTSPSAAGRRKTHCPQGHPYAGDNLYINAASGGRVCRECGRRHQREYLKRKRSQ